MLIGLFFYPVNNFLLPVGQSAQRRTSVEDDDDQHVGHSREEEEQGQQDVNDDARRGRYYRSFDVHDVLSSFQHRIDSWKKKQNKMIDKLI